MRSYSDEAMLDGRSATSPRLDGWFIRAAADGAAIGAGGIVGATVLEWGARHGIGDIALFELPRLRLFGWSQQGFLEAASFLISEKSVPVLIVLLALAMWRRTRPAARAVTAAAAAAIAGWAVALGCAIAFTLSPRVTVLLAVLALGPAARLARAPRSRITGLIVLTAGVAVGTLAAQIAVVASYGIVSSDEGGEQIYNPLLGFVPVVLLALAAAWFVSRFERVSPAGRFRQMARCWGLALACLAMTFVIVVEAVQLLPRAPEGGAIRVLNRFAYDVYIAGEPPALVWTDRRGAPVLDAIYGEPHQSRPLDERLADLVEKIVPSFDGGFCIAADEKPGIACWKPVPPHEQIPYAASGGWLPQPSWVNLGMSQLQVAVDPATRRMLLVSEVHSRYAVVAVETNAAVTQGTFGDSIYSAATVSPDPMGGAAFIGSLAKDGTTDEFDFASLRITRSTPNLYITSIVADPSGELFWGARPLTTELLGIDRRTSRIRHRIRIEATLRPLAQDAKTGMLYTCSYLFGSIYRVDPRTADAEKVGWCGRLCRNLRVDPERDTLWVATADGICRMPLHNPTVSDNDRPT